jgi:hypothetical protein
MEGWKQNVFVVAVKANYLIHVEPFTPKYIELSASSLAKSIL